jgi:hypothetical protein
MASAGLTQKTTPRFARGTWRNASHRSSGGPLMGRSTGRTAEHRSLVASDLYNL